MNIKLIPIYLLVLAVFSCNKESDNDRACGSLNETVAEATLNDDIIWSAQRCNISRQKNGTYNMTMSIYDNNCYLLEKLIIQNIQLELGKIRLFEANDVHLFTGHGDGISGVYILNENEDFENYLNIFDISSDSTEVNGEYQLYFVADFSPPSKPDTLIFTNGTFSARAL